MDQGVRIRVRDRVADRFVLHHALTPARAIPFVPTGWFERLLFRRLRETGALIEARPRYFYLDVMAYHARHAEIGRHAVPLAFFGAIGLAIVAVLLY